jgi:TolB-like protein
MRDGMHRSAVHRPRVEGWVAAPALPAHSRGGIQATTQGKGMAEDSPKSGEGSQAVQADMPRQGAGSHDVFVSYASHDAATANAVVLALERSGLTCWIAPRDVIPGSLYADEIVGAINDAKVVVLVLSQHSVASPHVGKEIERASSKRRRIVAFHMDAAPLTRGFEYFLSESQWIDVGSGGADVAIGKLVEAVRRHLDPTMTAEPRAHSDPSTTVPAAMVPSVRWMVTGGTILLVALTCFVVTRLWLSKRIAEEKPVAAAVPATVTASPAIPDKSVAVLPFVDMSQKKDQEYFTDGLSEELIDKLAHSIDLKVIARTSSFQFKGKNEDMRMIGQKLGVANLLEGSVRTSGKTLRVTAQLIKVSDGSHLWSKTYDRDSRDIFKVQDEISESVVAALQATMADGKAPSHDNTGNMAAYNAYLRGRYFVNKHNEGDSRRSIAEYEEAIRLEPRYAAAWVGLAGTYNKRGLLGWMPPKEAYAQARKAVDMALQINPNLANAHGMLAAILANYTFDFDATMAEDRRRHELDPSDAGAAGNDGVTALTYGHMDDAVRLLRLETERNPLSMYQWFNFAIALWSADRLKEAEAAARNLMVLDPAFSGAHCLLGKVLLAQGQSAAALAAMMEEQDQISRTSCVANAYWVLGRRGEADAMLAEIKAKYSESRAISLAESYASRGEKDEAFKWLMRAYDNREPWVIEIKSDPLLRNLRGDPRFTALLRKMKLPE